MGAFGVVIQVVKDLFEELYKLLLLNVLYLLIVGPLLGLAIAAALGGATIPALCLLLLAALPLGPASVGLSIVAQRIAEGRAFEIKLFFDGFRSWRTRAWKVYITWVVGLALILVNLGFYSQMQGNLGGFLTMLFIYLMAAWFMLLIYIAPLTVLQQDGRLRLIWRNALVLSAAYPIFSLLTLLLMAAFVAISTVLPILLLICTPVMLALWGMRATLLLVARDEAKRLAREGIAPEPPADDDGPFGRSPKGQVRSRK